MTAPTERTSVKDELDAMDKVWTILETLDHGARSRVVSWARDQVTTMRDASTRVLPRKDVQR